MQITRTKSEAGILVLVVFLLGLLVGGVGYRLWGARVFGSAPNASSMRGPQGRGGPPQPLGARLNMTPDQQKQLDAIYHEYGPQFEALDTQYRSQRDALRKDSRDKIRAILTGDQQTKFDEMMKEQDSRGRGRGPGPGGPPPGGDHGPGQGGPHGPGF
jgi:hypothetical protein